jgi:hypothetical protein
MADPGWHRVGESRMRLIRFEFDGMAAASDREAKVFSYFYG